MESLQLHENSERVMRFLRFATCILVVGILYLAREVLLPIAFAVLIAFLLAPLVVRLTRWGLPKGVAIIAAVSVTFAIIGSIGWIVATQAVSLAEELPKYELNLQQKIAQIKAPEPPAVIKRATQMFDNLRRQIEEPAREQEAVGEAPTPEPTPVPVEVRAPRQTQLEMTRDLVRPLLEFLGFAGIVIVLVVAMLFQREDLRDRFIELVSAGRINVATEALDDASRRVAGYLWMQLLVNATYGIPLGIGLYFIGVPSAFLWGLMATLLRFIPFIGPWIAAIFPVTLAFAVDPGWTMVLWTLGLVILMELFSNNVVEVLLYKRGTGISTLALLVGAFFWFWLWGPAGLVLATPLSVCLLVMGRYVPGLKFLSMLLGSEPTEDPAARLYQRLLAEDADHLMDLANQYVEEHGLTEFYEKMFIPALLLAEQDRHKGALTLSRQSFIFQASREMIDEFERRAENDSDEKNPFIEPECRMVGVPAADEADEMVALMLRSVLRSKGIGVDVLSAVDRNGGRADHINNSGVPLVFVSALPPSTLMAARQTSRRLRSRCPQVNLVLCVWARNTPPEAIQARLGRNEAHEVVTTFSMAVERLSALLSTEQEPRNPEVAPKVEEESRS